MNDVIHSLCCYALIAYLIYLNHNKRDTIREKETIIQQEKVHEEEKKRQQKSYDEY